MGLDARSKIEHTYLENQTASFKSIGKELSISCNTRRDVINRYLKSLTIEQKPGTGKKAVPGTQSSTRRSSKMPGEILT